VGRRKKGGAANLSIAKNSGGRKEKEGGGGLAFPRQLFSMRMRRKEKAPLLPFAPEKRKVISLSSSSDFAPPPDYDDAWRKRKREARGRKRSVFLSIPKIWSTKVNEKKEREEKKKNFSSELSPPFSIVADQGERGRREGERRPAIYLSISSRPGGKKRRKERKGLTLISLDGTPAYENCRGSGKEEKKRRRGRFPHPQRICVWEGKKRKKKRKHRHTLHYPFSRIEETRQG